MIIGYIETYAVLKYVFISSPPQAEPGNNALYLYAAYIDRRKQNQHYVRITAIIRKKTKVGASGSSGYGV